MKKVNSQLSQLFKDGITDNKRYSARNIFQNKKLIVYGAGNGFIAFNNTVLDRCNIKPYLVLDKRFKKGDTFNGIYARSIQDYRPSQEEKRDAIVVVTVGADHAYKTIELSLKELGFENIIKSSDIFEFNLHHIPVELKNKGREFYLQNRKNIKLAMELMSDELSRKIFYITMKIYITQKPEKIPNRPFHEQYFPKDISLT